MARPSAVQGGKGNSLASAYSPDGRFFAYNHDGGGQHLALWIEQAGKRWRVTRDSFHESEPDFSPDGERIAFHSEKGGGGIFVAGTGATGEARLLARRGHRPRFSPDGKWIAYHREESSEGKDDLTGVHRAFVVSTDGGESRELRPEFRESQAAVWTADGKHLIFDGTSREGFADWWATSLDGSVLARTNVGALLKKTLRAWSVPDRLADGRILFSGSRGDDMDLWEISLGSDFQPLGPAARLTSGADPKTFAAPGPAGRLAYSVIRSTFDVWSVPLDPGGRAAGDPVKLTSLGTQNRLPSLDAAGKRMVFITNRTGLADVFVTDLGADNGTALTSFRRIQHRPLLAASGEQVAYS
ncbi:MAG: TolB family protein, partial [Bryobacteraceae bacterium]